MTVLGATSRWAGWAELSVINLIKIRTKLSSVLLLRLVRIFMKQMLVDGRLSTLRSMGTVSVQLSNFFNGG